MSQPVILHISAEAERKLRFGHPWLYAEAIWKQSREGASGDLAAVYDRRKRFLAIGLYDPASPIRVRLLQRHKPAPIDSDWFAGRLKAAIALREPLIAQKQTTAFRLVHGENDGLPGLVIDRYAQALVIKLYSAAWAPHLAALLKPLKALWPCRCIVLRVSRNIAAEAASAGLSDGAVLFGKAPLAPVIFLENGLRFEADILHGHKTGFFLDQRDNRARVERFARNTSVLDVFAYTGGFSVYAARGGAREITSIDASAPALEACLRNMALNRKHPAIARARLRVMAGDCFALLQKLARQRARFDLVILDPPAFAQAQAQVKAGLKAYARLVSLGLAVLGSGGTLFISSCSSHIDETAFTDCVLHTARAAGFWLKIHSRTGHPLDHPVRFREGAYLKALFAQVRPVKEEKGGT